MGIARYIVLFGFYLSLAALYYAYQNKTFRPSFEAEALQPPVKNVSQNETIGALVAVAVASLVTPKRWF